MIQSKNIVRDGKEYKYIWSTTDYYIKKVDEDILFTDVLTSTDDVTQYVESNKNLNKTSILVDTEESISIGDILIKDHELSFQKQQGLASYGGIVYKESILDTQHGYPEFYKKYLSEFQEATGTDIQPFKQPVLTANGTLGGDSFAVYSNNQYSDAYAAWKAFNNVETDDFASKGLIDDMCLIMYNPIPLNITTLDCMNRTSAEYVTDYSIEGSNDNQKWTTVLASGTNTVTTAKGAWSINLSSNKEYYNYYRLSMLKGNGNMGFVEIDITATQSETYGRIKISETGNNLYTIKDKNLIDLAYERTKGSYYGIDEENQCIYLPQSSEVQIEGKYPYLVIDNVGVKKFDFS